jgi:hypothetical protein
MMLALHMHFIIIKINLKIVDGPTTPKKRGIDMNIFYIIGVIVVVLFIAGFFGLR